MQDTGDRRGVANHIGLTRSRVRGHKHGLLGVLPEQGTGDVE